MRCSTLTSWTPSRYPRRAPNPFALWTDVDAGTGVLQTCLQADNLQASLYSVSQLYSCALALALTHCRLDEGWCCCEGNVKHLRAVHCGVGDLRKGKEAAKADSGAQG